MNALSHPFYEAILAAEDPHATPDQLRNLLELGDHQVNAAIAGNPSAPADALCRLAESGKYDSAIAENPSSPSEALRIIAPRASDKASSAIASHPNCPQDVLSKLARHPNPWVRIRLAERPALPGAIVSILSLDPHPDVRLTLLKKQNLSPIKIASMLLYADHEMLTEVAHHPHWCQHEVVVNAWRQRASAYQAQSILRQGRVHPNLRAALRPKGDETVIRRDAA
jgi:hypothetical protein